MMTPPEFGTTVTLGTFRDDVLECYWIQHRYPPTLPYWYWSDICNSMSWPKVLSTGIVILIRYIDMTTELLAKRTVVIHTLDTSQLHLISSSVILDYASLGLSCSPFIQSYAPLYKAPAKPKVSLLVLLALLMSVI